MVTIKKYGSHCRVPVSQDVPQRIHQHRPVKPIAVVDVSIHSKHMKNAKTS